MWLRLKKLFVTCLNCSSVGFKWPRGQWLLRWAVCSSTPERFPSLAWAAAGALSSGPGAVDVPRTVDFVGMQPPRGAQGDGQPSRGAPSLSLGPSAAFVFRGWGSGYSPLLLQPLWFRERYILQFCDGLGF